MFYAELTSTVMSGQKKKTKKKKKKKRETTKKKKKTKKKERKNFRNSKENIIDTDNFILRLTTRAKGKTLRMS